MEEEPKFEFIDTPYREQPSGPHIAALSGVILLICDGIIIPSSGALYVSRESGGKGSAHMYEGTPKCGHQERSRG